MFSKYCDKRSTQTRKCNFCFLLIISLFYASFIVYQSKHVNWKSVVIQQKYFSDKEESRFKNSLNESSTFGKVIRRINNGWKILSFGCKKVDNFVLGFLNTPFDIPIFVYPKEQDQYVSGQIIDSGKFAAFYMNKLIGLLKDNPKAIFLDIGANVGVFTLTVAKYGFRVIAVESLHDSVNRLCSSMKEANLSNKITIVHNAASDLREEVSHKWPKGHISLASLVYVKDGNFSVNTILLDDLLEVFDIKQAVVKIDVNGKEDGVLNGAHEFFKRVKVESVLLKYEVHKFRPSGKFIVNFMAKNGLKPNISQHMNTLYGYQAPDIILFLPGENRKK